MAENFTITEIPGRNRLKVAVVQNPDGDQDKGVKSPEWMIKIDDLMISNVEGYEGFSQLYGWYGESSRFTSGDVGGPLQSSATLKHSDLILLIPNGGHTAKIETSMNIGKALDTIEIVRLANIKAAKVRLQTLEFKTCRIQAVQQQLDRVWLVLQVGSKTNTINVYDQMGANTGQMVSRVDYIKNTVEA
jgi:hypothetical protein